MGLCVGDSQIGSALAAEVACGYAEGIPADKVVDVRLKSAVAIAQQNRNGSWQARSAGAIEVGHRDI